MWFLSPGAVEFPSPPRLVHVALVGLATAALTAAADHELRYLTAPDGSHPALTVTFGAPDSTCAFRTINYITHTLPQLCLTVSPTPSVTVSESAAPTDAHAQNPTAKTTGDSGSPPSGQDGDAEARDEGEEEEEEEDDDGNDLSTGAFMSFEEWKAMMLAKADSDDNRQRRPAEGRGEAYASDYGSLGDEGEIDLDFDAYSDRISDFTSSSTQGSRDDKQDNQLEKVTHEEGLTRVHRSKDAGKTCKERFSYSSFDSGATVLKTTPGTKNPLAILVENKDSYMLLECATGNKFFIVELSDVILVDTVVLANYEFFSSMIRHFRVSVSDRYPVKPDKWKVLGTFEARNARDIQPFLVEHPQDWARYLRVEIISHWGNEYYCPLSLLRVHGTRMMDAWKELDVTDLENEDEAPKTIAEEPEDVEEPVEIVDITPEAPVETGASPVHDPEPAMMVEKTEVPSLLSQPRLGLRYPEPICYMGNSTYNLGIPYEENDNIAEAFGASPPADNAEQTAVDTPSQPPTDSEIHTSAPISSAHPSTVPHPETTLSNQTGNATEQPQTPTPSSSEAASSTSSSIAVEQTASAASPASAKPPTSQTSVSKSKNAAATSIKPPSSRSQSQKSGTSPSATTPRNKTATSTTSAAPSPTVQDSFFKALTKRLQTLESNTTLSMQYIESQSRFLQEALAKLEKRHVSKVDLFLNTLNNTVLSELREVRTQYDQIWQSTVIALETQREQSEREIVALSSRVGVLADEVVFQKRMAIVQSILLLICLVLVIFSRGFSGAGIGAESYYPSQFLPSSSSSRHGSPVYPTTPKAQIRINSPLANDRSGPARVFAGDVNSRSGTPVAMARNHGSSPLRTALDATSSQAPDRQLHQDGSAMIGSTGQTSETAEQTLRPTQTLARAASASAEMGLDYYRPPTPSSMELGYDSEPNMTPNDDYFSAAASVDGGDLSESERLSYPEMLARNSERQLTPSTDLGDVEYIPRPTTVRPPLLHVGSARKPLPALPEDPD